MDIYMGAFRQRLIENDKERANWSNYLKEVKDLDLSIFKDKLTVPALIPIGSMLSLRGELVHTNEVTVALGADYFVKCTVKQAEIIMQHRIKVAEEKLRSLDKEKEYIQQHLSFTNENVLAESSKEIIEKYDENEEKEWREKHRENVRKNKMEERLTRETIKISDDDLWEKLEKLELIEELEKELEIKEKDASQIEQLRVISDNNKLESQAFSNDLTDENVEPNINELKYTTGKYINTSVNESKLNMYDIDITEKNNIEKRVKELKKRLSDIKGQKTTPCVSQEDVFKRLERLEEQEMLEEELDRLEDEVYTSDEDNNNIVVEPKVSKKSISFVSDCESNCIEINFNHSDVSPEQKTYDKEVGISRPSDIYDAFLQNFKNSPASSILKKTKCAQYNTNKECAESVESSQDIAKPVQQIRRPNVIGDVYENQSENKENKVISSERPVSKFKAMRMQNNLDPI